MAPSSCGASSGVRATQGSKHNIYLAPGFTHVNMEATDCYAGTNILSTLVVINSDVGHNENCTFINPLWTVNHANSDIYGFTAHSNVSGLYSTLTITGGTISSSVTSRTARSTACVPVGSGHCCLPRARRLPATHEITVHEFQITELCSTM